MSEDYIEVIDPKKIAMVIIPIVVIVAFTFLFYFGDATISFFGEFDLPDVQLPSTQNPTINANYQKFLDFGLSENEVLWYQNYSCVNLEYANGTGLQEDGKFGAIYTQKLSECGLE